MIDFNTPREKILIIGNGFDLNLGLKTRYNDFLQSNEFDQLHKPNSVFSHLLFQKKLKNWIDIEIELKNYANSFTDLNFENDYQQLCNALINYIIKIDYSQINKTSYAYKLVAELLNTNFLIFDYNYTNSIMHIGEELGFNLKDLESRIIKIHGSAKEGKIIFGVEDQAKIRPQDVFLKKSYPQHFKAINVNNQLMSANQISIFGHSLGETDHTYFRQFFFSASEGAFSGPKRTIKLYFYDQTAYRDLHIQLDVLTNKSLMGLKQENIFQLIEVK